jgi:ERCC4-type nuclease
MEKKALQRNVPLTIIEDSREKPQAVLKINNYFVQIGARVIRSKMYVGDYQFMCNPYLVIDRKQNLNELCNNVVQDHKRFTDELKRAGEVGISVVVLVEHGSGIKCLDDVQHWENPRLKESPLAVSGERLYKILKAMEYSYYVRFEFCNKAQTGRRIVEILTEGLNGCKRPVS